MSAATEDQRIPAGPDEALAVVEAQRSAYLKRHRVKATPVLVAWGLAWLLGYAALALSRRADYSLPLVPYLFFCGCLAAALLFTFAYIVPKVRGIRGRSSREGTYYSLAWFLGMPLSALILSRVNAFLAALNTSQANEVASVVSNAVPCLVVASSSSWAPHCGTRRSWGSWAAGSSWSPWWSRLSGCPGPGGSCPWPVGAACWWPLSSLLPQNRSEVREVTGGVRVQRSERSESAGRAEGSAELAESAGAGAEVLAAATASAVDIDPVIHAQARLRIMATLAAVPVGDELHFPRLRELLDMTAGNLSTHLSKLEGVGYVQQNKTYSGRSPATYLALTPEGRVAFERYVHNLRALLDA